MSLKVNVNCKNSPRLLALNNKGLLEQPDLFTDDNILMDGTSGFVERTKERRFQIDCNLYTSMNQSDQPYVPVLRYNFYVAPITVCHLMT
jgi:phage-related protein